MSGDGSGYSGQGTSPNGLIVLLRAALIDVVEDKPGSAKTIASFDRAAADVLGRLLDGGNGTAGPRIRRRRMQTHEAPEAEKVS